MITSATVIGYKIPVKYKSTRKITKDLQTSVFWVINGSPSENLSKLIKLLGSIEKIIVEDDVVVIKPKVQWWNHGATNLCTLKTIIDLIINCLFLHLFLRKHISKNFFI